MRAARAEQSTRTCGSTPHDKLAPLTRIPLRVSCLSTSAAYVPTHVQQLSRRCVLQGLGSGVVLQQLYRCPAAVAEELKVVSDSQGFGTHPAAAGDLVLVHYVGTIAGTDTVFDSTRGGLRYRDGGQGILRPLAVRLNGSPVPGLCAGLQQGILGMTVGGRRTVVVPPELGFGSRAVLAPYAELPGGSALQYDIELIRLSTIGPDALVKGISKCGAGGAGATAENCATIEPAEYL